MEQVTTGGREIQRHAASERDVALAAQQRFGGQVNRDERRRAGRIDIHAGATSYGGTSTESTGLVRILKDLSASIAGEDVLLVEDIIDTGLTLNYLLRYLRGKGPASLRICTLLDKPARRLVEIPVDYTGFTIPDQFVVGYGLDYGELYRNLRFVGVLRPEVYGAAE